jgi:hypothetical protein
VEVTTVLEAREISRGAYQRTRVNVALAFTFNGTLYQLHRYAALAAVPGHR